MPGYGFLICCDFVFCQVEVTVTRRSLVQRIPIERDVFERDREASAVRRTRPTGGCRTMTGNGDMMKDQAYRGLSNHDRKRRHDTMKSKGQWRVIIN
jgi:hypothetical protein